MRTIFQRILRGIRLPAAVLALLALAFALAAPTPSLAAGVVGSGTPASCTESAFDAALSGGGVVTFNCGGAATIQLTFIKQIAADTEIDGGGLITLRATNGYHFQVFSGKSLTLRNITLANGASNAAGAIENFGTATLINTTLRDNRSVNNGGAVTNYGVLRLTNSFLENNKAQNRGGAVYNDGGQVYVDGGIFSGNIISGTTGTGGAIANNAGSISIQGGLFSGNHALDGGAIYVGANTTTAITGTQILSNTAGYGAGIENSGVMTVTGVTVAGNTSVNDGGGLWNLNGSIHMTDSTIRGNTAGGPGGGINHYGDVLVVDRVTISGNKAGGNGGGVYSTAGSQFTNVTLSGNRAQGTSGGGGFYQGNGNGSLRFATIYGNTAAFGAGVYKDGSATGGLYVQDVLLVDNVTGNCDGVVTSLGHNISDDTNCGLFTQPGDQVNVPVTLGPLANNGGPTLTHRPAAGSPTIDTGDCIPNVTTDQRGVARPYGSSCDVGSVEYTPYAVYLPLVRR